MALLGRRFPEAELLQEQDYETETERFREEYDRLYARNLDPRDILPPTSSQSLRATVDITNILLGDEMATVGASLDEEGFHWSLETAKNFWSEHPVRATLALATSFVPMAGIAARTSRAKRLASIPDTALLELGMVDDTVDLVRMGEKEKNVLRDLHHRYTQQRDLVSRIEDGTASTKDKVMHSFYRKFGNAYLEHTDPKLIPTARKEWQEGVNNLLGKEGVVSHFLRTMPDDETVGPLIARYLNDPTKLADIPKKYQPWAVRVADELRTTQSTMLQEGLITAEEAEHVGDIWFSMVREGTRRDLGNVTTVIDEVGGRPRVLTVPRTASPNLLRRRATKADVAEHITKQHAQDLLATGKADEALRLLKGDDYADARKLIESGDIKSARKLLGTQGKVDFTPKSLTFNTVFAQKQLLTTYRMLRDISLNPNITKTTEQIEKMASGLRKQWMPLDSLDGADRLRRMASTKKGEVVDELGWVPKRLFGEMKELVGGDTGNWAGTAGDYAAVLTAMYKTAKTAWNVPTHLQNTMGNCFFLMNAGINPFSKDFIKLQSLSLDSIRAMQKAARKGVGIEDAYKEITTLKLPSRIGGGDINILDELNSTELKNLLELSSMLQTEGIGVLQNIMKNAKGDVLKGIVSGYNSAVKTVRADWLSDLYMAEDGMAKMAYFLHLRQRGLSRSAALNEVGTRLPMYNTVGEVPASMRSHILPWITFPVEATRILKNNMIDHPLKTMMLIQMPEMLQLGAYGAGRTGLLGATRMNAQEIEQRKTMLPTWAHRPASFMLPWQDKNSDFRAAMMDWLPYSSAMPPSIHQEAPLMKKMPFGMDEPMPIAGALYFSLTGKDAWGRPIPTEGPGSTAYAAMLNTIGLIMPPLAERYLFNPTQPQMGYDLLKDIGQRVNPHTNKEGDPILDLFLTRLIGFKSYASSPEQQIANETFARRDLRALRSRYTREWSALMRSNDLSGAAEKLRDVHRTFIQEYGDPELVQEKFNDYLKRHHKDIAKHPQLRGLSREELESRVEMLKDAGPMRTLAMRELYETYRMELGKRGRTSQGGNVNPLIARSRRMFRGGFGGR